jgi:hypothetical protein
MTEAAAGMLLSMVVLVAKMSSANGIVTAALERDGSGYYFTGVQCYPLG